MRKRLDGGYGWAVVAAHFIVGCCVYGTLKSSGVMFVYLQDTYNTSYASTSTISLTQRLTETSVALVFSFLAERFGSRPIMLIGGIFLVVGAFCSAFARNITELTFTFGLPIGLGNAMLIYPGAQMIPRYFDKKLPLAYSLALTGGSVGPLVFPFIIRYAIGEYGLSGSFWIMAAVYLHVFISATLMRSPNFKREQKVTVLANLNETVDKNNHVEVKFVEKNGRDEDTVEESPTFKSAWNVYKKCFRNKTLILYYYGYMAATMSSTNFMAYQQAHARDRGISDPTLLALLASIWGICEIAAKITFAFVLQSGIISSYRVNQACLVLMAIVLVFYPMINSYWIIACCSGFLAFLWSTVVCCIIPTLKTIVGIDLCSPAVGLICCPIFLAYASVQLAGFVRDLTGTFAFVYYACAVILVSGIISIEIIAWRLKKSIFHIFSTRIAEEKHNNGSLPQPES